jgi:SAM-dependent methyltransferase
VPGDPKSLPVRDLRTRLRALWKSSVFNPYYLDKVTLWAAIEADARELEGIMLDVGCGNRQFEKLFTNVRKYVGIEHPGPAIEYEETLRHSFFRMRGIVDVMADAHALPFHDATFDACLCTEVLEHVPHPPNVAREIARVLRPGGKVLFTVPFVGELHHVPYDFQRFTAFGIRQVLEEAGLEVVHVKARGNFPLVAGIVTSHAIYRLGAREVRAEGSVSLHVWAMPFVFVACAIVQLTARFFGAFSKDEGYCVGYAALARRRVGGDGKP